MSQRTQPAEATPTIGPSTRHVVTKVVARAAISDIEPRDAPFTPGRQYLPTWAQIVYIRTNDDTWRVDSVQLSGPKLVKGGKPKGANFTEKWYGRPGTLPWLAELVDQLVPFDV